MKLILANNQSDKFVDFYKELQSKSKAPFDYTGYNDLLFRFDASAESAIEVRQLGTGRSLRDYDGIYINGYQEVYSPAAKLSDLYELAATVALACDQAGISYVNQELHEPPSLSKLSMHAKLAAAKVPSPITYGGTQEAILASKDHLDGLQFPAILKRADADRGVDNFKVADWSAVEQQLTGREASEIWLLQQFMPNDGYYLVSFYGDEPAFSIHRSLGERPDGDPLKAHFYKPKGGANATLIEIGDLPPALLQASKDAVTAMNRQIGSVDSLYDPKTKQAYILEVNYNPQLVTIETFKSVRQQALLDFLAKL